MLKILVKKQMLEIFRSYFYDAKKNKARSNVATIFFMFLFILLMTGVLGGIFTYLSVSLCRPMVRNGYDWLYFALMGLLAILLGTFGSIFNTYSSLYLAKDNDLLLSMPIPVSALLTSRLLSVYLMGFMYAGVVLLPAVIVYWVIVGITVQRIVGGMVLILLISLFVLTLSAILGWVVAKISLKLKNKSLITVLVSLVFIVVYYFVYFKAQTMIQDLLSNLAVYGGSIKKSAYPVYIFGNVGTGDGKSAVIMLLPVLVLFGIMWGLLWRSFLEVATATGRIAEKKYKDTAVKSHSISVALLWREFRHFVSSPNYMLNCGLGVFLTPVLAVAILWKGEMAYLVLQVLFSETKGCIPVILAVMLCGVASMNIITAPSVSLEGKNLWIVQSLPVTSWQVLHAKLELQLLLTGIPLLVCSACIFYVFPMDIGEFVLLFVQIISYAFLMAVWGLFIGVKKAVFTWTNETVPIKQSLPVMVTMLGGFVYTALLFVGYMMFDGWKLGYAAYISIFILGNVLAGMFLYGGVRRASLQE